MIQNSIEIIRHHETTRTIIIDPVVQFYHSKGTSLTELQDPLQYECTLKQLCRNESRLLSDTIDHSIKHNLSNMQTSFQQVFLKG